MRRQLVVLIVLSILLACHKRENQSTLPAAEHSNTENAACGCPDDFKDSRAFTTFMRYWPQNEFQQIIAVDVKGQAVFEGDIVLGTTSNLRALATAIQSLGGAATVNRMLLDRRNKALKAKKATPQDFDTTSSSLLQKIEGHRGSVQPWPGHRVAYDVTGIADKFLRAEIAAAIKDWEHQTQLTFELRVNTDARFISFQPRSPDLDYCYWDGSVASVDFTCIRHEIGHALGLLHEHTRSDRDANIKIHTENINRARCSLFTKNNIPGALCGSYDFASVMHYDPYAFTCNRQVTIEARKPNTIHYDAFKISSGDYKAVNAIDGVGRCN